MLRYLAVIGTLVLPVAAQAATAEDQETIIVTGKMLGYTTVETTTGTKTATPIINVPQAVSVVTDKQLKDQAIRSVADLVRLVPGVSAGQGEGHRDQITLRGNNTTADFFIDGLRDDVQYYRSFYNIDRVEVHKGPNAMIFGRGGGGGVINRITKGVTTDSVFATATGSVDSFGSAYGALDANWGNDRGGVRLNGFYEALANHRQVYGGERFAINPVGGLLFNDGGRVQFGYEYVRDDRIVDRGIPSDAGRPLADPAFRDSFFGRSDTNRAHADGHIATFRSEAPLGSDLKLSTQAQWSRFDKAYTNAYPATAVDRSGPVPGVGIEAYRDTLQRDSLIGQANIEARPVLFGMEHVLLAGVEFTDQRTLSERITGAFANAPASAANRRSTIPLSILPVIPPVFLVAGPAGTGNRRTRTVLQQASVYVQDQIKVAPWVELIAGLRYDRFDLSARNLFTGTDYRRVDGLWSPRAGLVFKPKKSLSLYASYTRSYLPQSGDQFTSLDATLAALEPEKFVNWEIGAKWEARPGLLLTLAAYRLDRTNTRAPGPTPGTTVLTGGQRSEGFEASVTGRVTDHWQTAIGYAYTDATITATTAAAPAGRRVAQVPRHQLSVWNRFDVTPRLGLGAGLYHQSSQFASISNAVVLPAYTRLDAALFYKLTDKIEAQLNVENLTGTRYFPVGHNDNNISTGAPFNARLTVAVKF